MSSSDKVVKKIALKDDQTGFTQPTRSPDVKDSKADETKIGPDKKLEETTDTFKSVNLAANEKSDVAETDDVLSTIEDIPKNFKKYPSSQRYQVLGKYHYAMC